MTGRTRLGCLAALGVGVVACQHHGELPRTPDRSAARDSVVGAVQLVGVDALPTVVLLPDDGTAALTLVGPSSLRHVDGLHVSIVGVRAGTRLTVQRFTVIAANGAAATDGRLVAFGDTLYIITAGGARHVLVSPSRSLWAHLGQRVWVSGPLDREPLAYGMIE